MGNRYKEMIINAKVFCVGCGQYLDAEDFDQHGAACRELHDERLSNIRKDRGKRGATVLEGPVNINTASMEELQTLPAIGVVMAERLTASRPFHQPMDVLKVDGLGQYIWSQLQEHIVV